MLDQAQLNRIQDPQTRQVVELLANHLEQALTDNDTLRAENQRLRMSTEKAVEPQGAVDRSGKHIIILHYAFVPPSKAVAPGITKVRA